MRLEKGMGLRIYIVIMKCQYNINSDKRIQKNDVLSETFLYDEIRSFIRIGHKNLWSNDKDCLDLFWFFSFVK